MAHSSPRPAENSGGNPITTEKMLEEYQCVNERLVWCRLKGKYINVTVVQAYAPTEDKTDEQKEEFYESLRAVVENVRQHDMLILMGDFNAKVGQEDVIWREVMGAFGVRARRSTVLDTRVFRGCKVPSDHKLVVS